VTSNPSTALWAVVPAAGTGSRMQSSVPKQYLPLYGRSVIECSLQRLASLSAVQGIVVALAADDPWWPTRQPELAVPVLTVVGGEQRCDSVQNALALLSETAAATDWVMVHDAARPCVQLADLENLYQHVTQAEQGGLLAVPVRDTMKRAASGRINNGCIPVAETVDRDNLWHALTPQMFRLGELQQALSKTLADGRQVTDEASAMEHTGYQPLLVEGHHDNIKITHPDDLALAEFYLGEQEKQE